MGESTPGLTSQGLGVSRGLGVGLRLVFRFCSSELYCKMALRLGVPCFGRVNVDVFIRDTVVDGRSGELFLGAASLSLESAESFAFVPSPSEEIPQDVGRHYVCKMKKLRA